MMPKRLMSLAAVSLAALSLGKAGDVIARSETDTARTARRAATEFGTHDRPWARDLLKDATADGAHTDPGTKGPDPEAGTAPQCSFLDTLDAAIANAYVAPIETMRALEKERQRLAAEAQTIAEKRALADAAILRADTHVRELRTLRQDIEGLLTTLDAKADEDIERMRSLYETMKPKAAADILKSMDVAIIVQVLDRMPDRRAAPILSNLPVDLARAVMQVFAERHRPKPT